MANLYHILHKLPAVEAEEMLVEYEYLAQSLVKSGKLRVDAEPKGNFVRLSEPSLNVNLAISREELVNPELEGDTRNRVVDVYKRMMSGQALNKKVDQVLQSLKQKVNMLLEVEPELLLKLARLLVQSAHPIVIHWLLLERVEVFISYSWQIGDVMDIVMWKYAGQNSGMQSTSGSSVAIFVSCGGDPFGEYSENSPTYGNGWPAIARLQIIAAQELGHYSDIYRDIDGNMTGRHSANFACTRVQQMFCMQGVMI